ncbi:MAG: family 43 glycosylhydrolase [Acholeplasmatales bacterium]|nr:family 43 glycosylhydrolase [Acholeplasmatales bacterium]
MNYQNPIIKSDYSDPDVIRVNDSYYMIASSFNHTPCLPILKSENLVDWKIVNYIWDKLPFDTYDKVMHGCGVWAPSIREHNNKFYALVPFPDEGIFVTETDDIENGKWSEPRLLIKGPGIEDPCPIWVDDKCYLVVGFVKSRIGFNSMLAVYEVSSDLTKQLSDYKIVFDGHNIAPTVEGPKFHFRNGFFYILAPCGSVKTGWQIALRSKNIYGPYEMKIILMQNDSKINGPHQGALIDMPNDEWAFIHFSDQGPYGRVICLEPARWIDDWPVCGLVKDELLAGTAVENHPYLIDKKSDYKIQSSDDFKDNKLSLMWQCPANIKSNFFKFDNGIILNAINGDIKPLNLLPNSLLTKILYPSFEVETKAILNLEENDEAGLCYMGQSYSYITIKRINNKNHLLIKKGNFNDLDDEIIYDEIYDNNEIIFNLKYIEPNKYSLGFNNKYLPFSFIATPGRWIGGKYGIYAKGLNNGYAKFDYFKCNKI